MTVHSIVRNTAGQVQSWKESGEIFTVNRDASGRITSVTSRVGRWGRQNCAFNYDVNGVFIGTSVALETLMKNVLLEDAMRMSPTIRAATGAIPVAQLPAASAANRGMAAVVSNATVAYTSANVGATVVGGGAHCVPVFCNGTAWVIG